MAPESFSDVPWEGARRLAVMLSRECALQSLPWVAEAVRGKDGQWEVEFRRLGRSHLRQGRIRVGIRAEASGPGGIKWILDRVRPSLVGKPDRIDSPDWCVAI